MNRIANLARNAFAALACSLAASLALAAVELNRADQPALETVRGIGPALSGKLMAERAKSAFKDWSDVIERVSGVGPGSAAKLSAAGLTVQGKAYDAGAVAASTAALKPERRAADKKPPAAATERADAGTTPAAR